MTEYGFNTMLLHGVPQEDPYGATHTPIYQSSAFQHKSAEDLENIFTNKAMGFSYTRINNPTVEAFEKRITKLEHGVASVACASGMAALFNALANILQVGDEVVAAAGLYGGTVELFEDLESFGITTRYVTENEPEAYEKLKSDERGSRARTTKEGFLYYILKFLERQGLIEYIEQDDMIKTTKKMDHFMDWNLLNKNNYQRVLAVFNELDDPQSYKTKKTTREKNK